LPQFFFALPERSARRKARRLIGLGPAGTRTDEWIRRHPMSDARPDLCGATWTSQGPVMSREETQTESQIRPMLRINNNFDDNLVIHFTEIFILLY
jgi:hypothetical protein